MIETIVVLGKVAIVCGAGFAVATGLEWFNDFELRLKSKSVSFGSNEKGVKKDGDDFENFRKKVRQQG